MADESGQQQRSKRAKQPTERARLADERGILHLNQQLKLNIFEKTLKKLWGSRSRLCGTTRSSSRQQLRKSSGLLGAAGAGFQLLLGPGTSGVDVNFLFSVLDVGAS